VFTDSPLISITCTFQDVRSKCKNPILGQSWWHWCCSCCTQGLVILPAQTY